MLIPWKLLFSLFVPSIPEIISTVRTLKKEHQREKTDLDDAAMRLFDLEQRIETQLQLLEQLTIQVAKLEKTFLLTLWASIFAVVLALLALGVVVFK
jgi:uncharacterized coiled-coil protein SlyX